MKIFLEALITIRQVYKQFGGLSKWLPSQGQLSPHARVTLEDP